MDTSLDRQGILDNLTAIETTAKLLVNAFVKKNNEKELSFDGIHREELINQTTTFLSEAQQLILNLSDTFNLKTDGFFEKSNYGKPTETNGQSTLTSVISDASQNCENEEPDCKSSPIKKIYSLSSVTLQDIIQNRLTLKTLLPNYPLLHDSVQPNLVTLARIIRQIDNLDDLIFKIYSKIFNQEERTCCNSNGTNGKLPYPRHKCLLFDQLIKLTYNERNKTLDHGELHRLYTKCEAHFSTETSVTKFRGLNIDHLNENNNNSIDEKQFICSLFRLVIPQDDIKRIVLAKQDLSSQWNDNQICIYYARPIHLLWIKQKWLERYPVDNKNEAQKWSECIDWAVESFLETTKILPSKRKTMDESKGPKRSKPSLTFPERVHQINRTKVDVFEYATQLLQFIFEENEKNLPTLEQLQLLEHNILRFYWTVDQQKTWSQILDLIRTIFLNESNDNFLDSYSKQLLEMNRTNQIEIERLLQVTM